MESIQSFNVGSTSRNFFKDMDEGYSIELRKFSPGYYEVKETALYKPSYHYRLSTESMTLTFSKTIIFLLSHGFSIRFRKNVDSLGNNLELYIRKYPNQQAIIIDLDELKKYMNFDDSFNHLCLDKLICRLNILKDYQEDLYLLNYNCTQN